MIEPPLVKEIAKELLAPGTQDLSRAMFLQHFNETLCPLIERMTPKTLSCAQTHKAPWYTPELKKLKQQARRAEARWRKKYLQKDLDFYRLKIRVYHTAIAKQKKLYWNSQLDQAKNNPGLYSA